jgi:hypothetical protein
MLAQAALSQAGQEVEAARASSFSLEREVESLRNTVADLQASQVGFKPEFNPSVQHMAAPVVYVYVVIIIIRVMIATLKRSVVSHRCYTPTGIQMQKSVIFRLGGFKHV